MFFDEVEQFIEIFIGFPGESYHQGGADVYAGDFSAHFVQQAAGLVGRYVPAHIVQHIVGNVLEGYVEICAHVFTACHHVKKPVGEFRRVCVMQANPFHPVDIGETVNQFW